MSSELRVDKIVPIDGVPTGGGGGIIQVKQIEQNMYSMPVVIIHQLVLCNRNATITPKFNTSKKFIDCKMISLHKRHHYI